MPSHEEDTRKVQTAVIGQPGSDWPVFLPFDHEDFDGFMRGRSRDDFYCGTLLGGCGKKLTAKRYLHKKCHFAHRPPVHCRRTQTGEDSADHLYIGQALQRWLRRQGHQKVRVSYPDLGSGPGGAVEVRFGPGARLIRVQMERMSLQQWEATRARLADTNVRVHWSYGPDSGIAHNEVKAEGHAIRFTCRTEGETRRVYVGTQRPDHSIELAALDECRLTDEGIVTPHLTEEPPTTADADAGTDTTALLAFPLVPGKLAFTATFPAKEQNVTARRVYEADVQPVGSAMTRIRIALPLHAVPPSPHRLNVIESTAHLIPLTDSTEPSWLIEAVGFTPLPATTDPRWPDLRPTPEPHLPEPRPTPQSEAGAGANAEAKTDTEEPLPVDETALVESLRERLAKVARSHGIINWETLVGYAGHEPSDFDPEDRVRLLVAVGYPRTSGRPVLASLIKLAGHRPGLPTFFGDVLAGLGWDSDLPESEVEAIWARQQQAAYRTTISLPATTTTAPLTINTELLGRLRAHLHLVARGRGVIRWSKLLKKAGIPASTVTPQDGVRLLAAVDLPYGSDRPLLSSLIRDDGQRPGPVPFFSQVLKEVGWNPTATIRTADAAWMAERERTYAVVAQSARGSKSTHRLAEGGTFWTKRGVTRAAVVKSIRVTLISAARRQVRVSWHTLAAAAGLKPEDLSDKTRALILVEVDRPSGPTGVLLSSLVISTENTPVPYFAEILERLGRPHSMLPIELGRLRKLEQARAFAAYEQSADGGDA
ncbi:competence protein CoiA family protein [Streptomyces mirabilis]|uniref:competence protein CoiA family protein n=1 Tax=Streptomyces mirabilis TaxID=68239 RepID=UPI0036736B1F